MTVVRCPGCNRQLNVPDSARRVQCPQCHQAFAVDPNGIASGPPETVAKPAKASPSAVPSAAPSDPAPHGAGRESYAGILMTMVAAVILVAVAGGAAACYFVLFAHAVRSEPEWVMATTMTTPSAVPLPTVEPVRAPWSGEALTLDFGPLEWDSNELAEDVASDEWKKPKSIPNTQTGVLSPTSPLWPHLKGEIGKKNTRMSALVNGFQGRDKFQNVPEEGALLIGFLTDDHMEHLNYVRPIYLTATEEKLGPAYGVPDRFASAPGDVLRIKARPGYAVGEITVRAGEVLDGFGVVFMKVTENGLDPSDSYRSPWLGGRDGSTLIIGGDGSFLVGVHGKIAFDTGSVPDGAAATLGAVKVNPKQEVTAP